MRLALAILCLLAMPLVAVWQVKAQQAPYVTFDGVESAIQYKVRVRTLDETVIHLSNYPHEPPVTTVELKALPESPYWIDAAAVAPSGYTGEWGPYTPYTQDWNEDGVVSFGDFIALLQSGSFGDFPSMLAHWGDETELIELPGGSVRGYSDAP